jgi:hypothetical protein
LLYNAVVLAVGVAAIAGMEWLMGRVIPLGEDAIEPMALVLGVVVYGKQGPLNPPQAAHPVVASVAVLKSWLSLVITGGRIDGKLAAGTAIR